MHTAEHKCVSGLAGKRVLVMGLGESGSDIALAVAKVAAATALSTRSGPGYIIPRRAMGAPADLDTNRLYHSIPRWIWASRIIKGKVWLEEAIARWRSKTGEARGDNGDDFTVLKEAARINAERGRCVMERFATKNTSFVEAMLHHGALYKPGVERLTEDSVVFEDGSSFKCDVVICATGFKIDLPFLPAEIAALARTPRRLFKHTFVPALGSRIAFAGFARPNVGAVPPVAEMQARWFARVISGEVVLPTAKSMAAEAAEDDKR